MNGLPVQEAARDGYAPHSRNRPRHRGSSADPCRRIDKGGAQGGKGEGREFDSGPLLVQICPLELLHRMRVGALDMGEVMPGGEAGDFLARFQHLAPLGAGEARVVIV